MRLVLKVLFDLTYIPPGSVSGVATYAFRLLRALDFYRDTLSCYVLATDSNVSYIKSKLPGVSVVQVSIRFQPLVNRVPHILGILNRAKIEQIIADRKIDAFVSPYISNQSFSKLSVPHIGVLHDVQTFHIKKKQRIKGAIYTLSMQHILKGIDEVVTISNYSQSAIVGLLPFLKSKLSVVYNSIDSVSDERYEPISIKRPYVLNVNALEPYKNIVTLLKAFHQICDSCEHVLVIKAKKTVYWNTAVYPLIVALGICERVILIDESYTEQQMASLYKNASLFIMPSLMEGFGYTPIEAALHNVPVISSKCTAIFETTKGLLNYYEPADSSDNLAKIMLSVLNIPPDADHLAAISQEYLDSYSAKKQCEQFISIFKKWV